MALTISNISAVLKKVIVPKVQSQLEKDLLFYNQIKKNVGVTIANNNIYIPSRVGHNSGVYAVAEGTEPRVGQAKYAQPVAPMKFVFGSIELTDQSIEATNDKDVKAVAAALKSEIDALQDSFQLDMNRMFQGAGTGKLCLANGAGSAVTTLVVDGNPNGGDGTQYLREGGYISIGGGSAVQIASVDSATQVTLASAATWSDNAVVTRASADEPMGLAGIIDDGDNVGTFQGITRSSSPYYNAHTDDTSEALSEADMIDIYLRAQEYGKGRKAWLMGRGMFKAYGSLLLSTKKTADLKEVLSGGWKGLEFMDGTPVLLDFHTWSGTANLIDFESLTIAQMSDPMKWLEADAHGGILRRSPSNRANWEGTMKWYCNLVALKVKTMGRLSNKT